MKKKIVAILATIAAVFGFGFAANSAMADDQYGATATVSGTTVTFQFTGLAKGNYYVASQSEAVSAITLAAAKSNVKAVTVDNGTANATVTVKASCTDTKVTATLYNADSNKALVSQDATVPATGDCAAGAAGAAGSSNGTAQTASTGAAIAPYAVAVVLLAAAGISLVAVRKSSAR